jgi:hypothetical protein
MIDDVERLEEIKDEIKELVEEAIGIVRSSGTRTTYETARTYWYAHILGALDKDHEFLGGSMTTMEDTIEDVEEDQFACNGCGCKPGDGTTEGCNDPEGCGFEQA